MLILSIGLSSPSPYNYVKIWGPQGLYIWQLSNAELTPSLMWKIAAKVYNKTRIDFANYVSVRICLIINH